MMHRVIRPMIALVALATMTSVIVVRASQDSTGPKTSWDVQITKAKRSGNKIELDISFRYLGTDSNVPAPLIQVRDAMGAQVPAASDTKGGRDKECVSWLSMSGFIAIGLKPPALSADKVRSCQAAVLTYFFGVPKAAKPPFELLFADAPPWRST